MLETPRQKTRLALSNHAFSSAVNGFTAGFVVVLRCSAMVGDVPLRAAGPAWWVRLLLAAQTAEVDPKTSRAARATLVSGSMLALSLQGALQEKQ
jgi:hypothetical protein